MSTDRGAQSAPQPCGINGCGGIAEHRYATSAAEDLVVCSTARRARDTAKRVIEALGCRARYDDAVYAADADDLLAIVQNLDDADRAVMLVGHNPSMEDLTALLCGRSPAYPTAALGSIDLAVDHWADVSSGCGTLASFVTPAELDAIR